MNAAPALEFDPTARPTGGEKPRLRWTRPRRLVATAVLIATVAIGVVLSDPWSLVDGTSETASDSGRDTAVVALAALGESYSTDGTLLYDGAIELVAGPGGAGVVTEIVAEGDRVARGDVVWRHVNGPVVLLYGDVPAHRSLGIDSVGPDVTQVEESLVALGYDPDATVTIDDTYTANTAAMVERWQEDIGAAVTGTIADGQVVFMPGPSRVGVVTMSVGGVLGVGTPVLQLSALDRVVTFTVPAADRETLAVGDVVDVRLPDRSTFAATVVSAVIDDSGTEVVTAVPDDPIAYLVDTVPVSVDWSVAGGPDVLTVPASAVVRTDSGHYHLELVTPTGTTQLVPVDLGASSGLLVAVTGSIAEGDVVIAP